MRNDFCSNYLQHSAKGTSWTKENHKYIARVEAANGHILYFYTQQAYDAYMKDRRKQITNDLKNTDELRKEKKDSKAESAPSNELLENGARRIAEFFNSQAITTETIKDTFTGETRTPDRSGETINIKELSEENKKKKKK